MKIASGNCSSNHGARRALADHQHAVLDLVRGEGVDRVGKDVEALFHHDPAEEGDHQLVVGDADRAPPRHVAALGVELVAVDAARPDRDVAVHALRAKDRGGRFGRRHHHFAAAVEAAQDRAHVGLEHLQMIISEIGLEPRVDRGHGGDLVLARPGHRAMADDVGAGDMDDVGVELGEVALDPAGKRDWDAIFVAGRDWDRGNADEIAGGFERGMLHGRRVDAHLHALAQQIAHEAIQCLVGSVPHIIVIAREQSDAKIGGLHDRGL